MFRFIRYGFGSGLLDDDRTVFVFRNHRFGFFRIGLRVFFEGHLLFWRQPPITVAVLSVSCVILCRVVACLNCFSNYSLFLKRNADSKEQRQSVELGDSTFSSYEHSLSLSLFSISLFHVLLLSMLFSLSPFKASSLPLSISSSLSLSIFSFFAFLSLSPASFSFKSCVAILFFQKNSHSLFYISWCVSRTYSLAIFIARKALSKLCQELKATTCSK